MTKDMFEARREAFEEELFRKKDAQLVDKLKGLFHQRLDREAIRPRTGVTDEYVRRLDGRVRSIPVDRGRLGRWTKGLQDGRAFLDRFYSAVEH